MTPPPSIKRCLRNIPENLSERARINSDKTILHTKEYILYWMQGCMRLHDNPTLELAITLAQQLQKKIFIYQEIQQGLHSTDREMHFVLEGAKAVSEEAFRNNIGYSLCLVPAHKKNVYLQELAEQSVLVLTDDSVLHEKREEILVLERSVKAPVVAVDTHNIIPALLVPTACTSLRQFQEVSARQRKARLGMPWDTTQEIKQAEIFIPPALPFSPVNFHTESFAALLAKAACNHTVLPVQALLGGSEAGYQHWKKMRSTIFRTYPESKENPFFNSFAVLAPYLSYGMISPFRLAYELALENTEGAWHFLGQLFSWRELANNMAWYGKGKAPLALLPEWARYELLQHREDPRVTVYDEDTLANAQTRDALWNTLQTGLIEYGFIPEQIFPYWGKKIIEWTADVEQALPIALSIYRRFALAGRDPYLEALILDCFGLLAEPAEKSKAIFGKIPYIDLQKLRSFADQTASSIQQKVVAARGKSRRIAVIGAGISGLTCAQALQHCHFQVDVFDKGRRVGGRVSNKVTESASFDMGAPIFTAKGQIFRRQVKLWEKKGLLQQWHAQIYASSKEAGLKLAKSPYVAVPSMAAIAEDMAATLQSVQCSTHITRLEEIDGGWRLYNKQGENIGFYDMVILALPAPQALLLLEDRPLLKRRIEYHVRFVPIWSAMVVFEKPLPIDYHMVAIGNSAADLAFRDGYKPKRDMQERWVIHSTTAWAKGHIDVSPARVAQELASSMSKVLNLALPPPTFAAAHLWRYAQASQPLYESHLYEKNLGVCGDWCLGTRIEDAYLSGTAMAARVANELFQNK